MTVHVYFCPSTYVPVLIMGEFGMKAWTRLKKISGSDFRSSGESGDYMPTLIQRIVLVLKIESLLYDGILIVVSSMKRE